MDSIFLRHSPLSDTMSSDFMTPFDPGLEIVESTYNPKTKTSESYNYNLTVFK